MSASKKESPEAGSRAAEEPPVGDGWLSWLLLAVFLVICLAAWYLVRRASLRGAPTAPVGAVRAEETNFHA